ncbi:MAG: putative toxin-antitoxin system toxin component, PIN family [Phycisphaeraceae bacterium]
MSIPVVYDAMLLCMRAARPHRSRATFELVEAGLVQLFLSEEVVAEVKDVITRPSYVRQFPALCDPAAAVVFIARLRQMANLISPVPIPFALKRDPKDSKYINLAIAADAEFLVTRDLDLLDLTKAETPQAEELRALSPRLKIVEPGPFVQTIFERTRKNA